MTKEARLTNGHELARTRAALWFGCSLGIHPPALVVLLAAFARATLAQLPPGAEMSYLDNGTVRVGVDLRRGGAIVFLARDGGENVINNFDRGRQVQLSFYSGPVPFIVGDKRPAEHWEHLGWNPVQAGDDFGHGSRIVAHRNDGRMIHVQCAPMQWPLNDVPADCQFESWIELDGAVVKARARLTNARTDMAQYPARQQELPAAYANAPFHRVVSYMGDRPFTGGEVSDAPKPVGAHPWSFWRGTECWSALLDANDRGLGLITPGRIEFTGGFAGRPGPNDTLASGTGYLAGQGREILDHQIVYEYRYELLPGTLAEIRARAEAMRPSALPAWTFENDRQGWHYAGANDTGWPIRGALDMRPSGDDPQLIGPFAFWRAEDAPMVVIDAAFETAGTTAKLYWQRLDEPAWSEKNSVEFSIQNDAEFHRYPVRAGGAASYTGGMIRLRIDPSPGERVRVRAVRLARE